VVKRLGVPLDERETFPVVFRVATRALLARPGRNVVRRVKSVVSLEAVGDLGMAFQTLKSCLSPEFMTARAIR
jgi:hypothetical protein